MKPLQTTALAITLITLFASCQSNTDVKQILSKSDTRKEIMDSIANNSAMSKEMMETFMNGKNDKMIMENHGMMMKMMKDKPGMMKSMMEMSKVDSSMICPMCGKMMGNDKMADMKKKMPAAGKATTTEKKDEHQLHH